MANIHSFEKLFSDTALLDCPGDWVVGFSGGVDSRFLLQASVLANKNKKNIKAVYVNHGLSPNAQDWQAFCEEEAGSLDVPFQAYSVTLPVDVSRKGIEQLARQARYEVFERCLSSGDVLLLGHHLSDQAETLLSRLMRGSGVKGLTGIPFKRQLANGATIVRPLLHLSKEQIIKEARHLNLQWIEDESNVTIDFERNYIRQKVMPLIVSRWPQAEQSMAMTAQNCQQDAALLDEVAANDLRLLEKDSQFGFRRLSLQALESLSNLRQRNALRYWLSAGQNYRPGGKVIDQLYQDVIWAKCDTTPRFVWGDIVLHKYRNSLWCINRRIIESIEPVSLMQLMDQPLNIKNNNSLGIGLWATVSLTEGEGDYQLRFGQKGLKCRMLHQQHNKPLKKLFQEAGIPPWLRDSWPLVFKNDQLCFIPRLGLCHGRELVQAMLSFD